MGSVLSDLRYAIRTFRTAPGLTVVAIVTLALGIAANVTVFSFIDSIFLRPLPVKNANRLVRVLGIDRQSDDRYFSWPAYAYIRDHSRTLDTVVAHYSTAPLYVQANGQSGEVSGAVASWNYFATLGVTPRLGRFFTR